MQSRRAQTAILPPCSATMTSLVTGNISGQWSGLDETSNYAAIPIDIVKMFLLLCMVHRSEQHSCLVTIVCVLLYIIVYHVCACSCAEVIGFLEVL